MRVTAILTATAMAAALAISAPAKAVPVDLELSLVVDISGSVSSTEYDLMMGGYANAFRDSAVQTAILAGTDGAIAANLVFFDTIATENIGFTLLDSAAAIDTFADALDNILRPRSGGTNIFTGITLATSLFGDETGGIPNGFESDRQVIDVSGDGTSNATLTEASRDAAIAAGVDAINGITIGATSIETFYQNSVIAGEGSFVIHATSFDEFEEGVAEKLAIEVGVDPTPGIPEPGTLALFGLGLAGLGLARRRRAA